MRDYYIVYKNFILMFRKSDCQKGSKNETEKLARNKKMNNWQNLKAVDYDVVEYNFHFIFVSLLEYFSLLMTLLFNLNDVTFV